MRSHGDNASLGALLVHPSGLLDLVMAIFEEYWKTRDPAASRTTKARADGVDRDVLKLLLLGLTRRHASPRSCDISVRDASAARSPS